MKNIDKTKPLVSVIMPVFNAEKYLRAAIESILSQTYRNFEFIIVDDASTDSSWEIIRSFKKKNPKMIRAISLKKNLNNGGDACANEGFKMAKGKYIARMDADDIAHPKRLERQVLYMEKNKDIILLGTQAYVIDKDGRVIGNKSEPLEHEAIVSNYFIFHPIIHPSVMIRRSLLPKRKSLYTIKYNANNDLLTFFKLLRFGRFANLSEKLHYYRIHGKNDSLINPKEKFFNTIRIRLYAWRNLAYKPTPKAIFYNLAQLMITLLFPSSFITSLYMWWRGLSYEKISFR
ncbi:glycosyltransferase family 2 protein [Candidatus Gottesmanbacteria bacterium]|nr:glycosyltransferase family 2 protein [Candidatus Gottesmanbacteria bacterium]